MLQQQTMSMCFNLADSLTTYQNVLAAKPNTILSRLVTITNNQIGALGLLSKLQTVDGENTTLDTVSKFYSDMCNASMEEVKGGGRSLHDVAMDEAIEILKTSVNKHISFAKNVVKPSIETFISLIENNYRPVDTLTTDIQIVTYDLPELLSQYNFMESIANYKSAGIFPPDLYIPFNAMDTDALTTMLMTGDAGLDDGISKFVATKPDVLKNVYEGLFVARNMNLFREISTKSEYERLETAIMVYLLANKFYNNPPEYLSGISLSDYNTNMGEFRNYAGALISNTLDVLKPIYDSKTLVIYVKPKEIGVIGDVYREWLTTGGTIETLLGMAITGERYSGAALISENKTKLEEAWFNHLSFRSSASKLTEFGAFKDAIKFAFAELMKSHVKEEDEIFNTPNYMAKVSELFEVLFEDIRTTDMENRTMLALRIVGKARFFYTDSFKILSIIEAVCRDNTRIDPSEAALIAAIEYMADYMADQILIARV